MNEIPFYVWGVIWFVGGISVGAIFAALFALYRASKPQPDEHEDIFNQQ